MARKKGDLSKSGPKSHIIKLILENSESVEESEIREGLKKKNEKTDQGNVNRYLHELQEDSACIELKTSEKGQRKYNLWNITKIEQLKNIRFNFPEMPLNKYEKSINIIIIKKFNFAIGSMRAKKAFVQLSLSVSFFDKCLDTDIETLCARAPKLYQSGEFFSIERQIEGLTHEAYPECMKRIQKIPDIWPVGDDESIKDSPQRFQNNAISEEKFKRMLNEIKFSLEEKDHYERTQRIIKELSMKISHEILSKRLKEIPKESLQNQEVSNKMSDEIFEKLMEEFPVDLPDKIYAIIVNQYQYTSIVLNQIFDHFYQRDVIDGSDSHEEHKFVFEISEITAISMLNLEHWGVKVEKLDHLYEDYYEKCRKKMGII
ncbi:MAG: hypothetical protein WB014_03060 [Methanosarcina sp.]